MKELDLYRKLDVLKDIDAGLSFRRIREKYGISIATVSSIKKSKLSLLKAAENNDVLEQKSRKRLKGNALELDERLFQWFTLAKSKNISINGPVLKGKALKVAGEVGLENFRASNGWLESFQKRHNITFKSLSEKSACMDPVGVTEDLETCPTIGDSWENEILMKNAESKDLQEASDEAKKDELVTWSILEPHLNMVEKYCYQDAELIDLYNTLKSKMEIMRSSKTRQASTSD